MKLDKINYFSLFDLKPSFYIDKAKLKKNYFDLNKKYHPDVNQEDKNIMTRINKGYDILVNDYSRAKYLSRGEYKIQDIDTSFLASILDLEDEITNIQNKDEYNNIYADLKDKIEICKHKYKDIDYLTKWGYYERLMKLLKKRSFD